MAAKNDLLSDFEKITTNSQGNLVVEKLKELTNQVDENERKGFSIEMEGFLKLFSRYLETRKRVINWEAIKPPPKDLVVSYSELPECPADQIQTLASKLCVLKLNGGLGTTMGCVGPKSVIEVTRELSFLDLTVQQIEHINGKYKVDVPLILMDSFNTHDETLKVIHKYENSNVSIHTFNQSRYPRVLKESLHPLPKSPKGDKDEWYPPGHGDVYQSLANSGLLKKLLDEGKEYIFISNVDNLGATVDFKILKNMVDTGCEFVMEVTDKTRSDIKGGTLIEYNGRAKLLEIAQVPSSKVDEFKSVKKFKIFNTNNLWVSLKAIQRFLQEESAKDMDIIVNTKKFNGKDIIQLEVAAGAAIEFFKGSRGINVKRNRFLPVKSTSDLLLMQSNLYTLENGRLIMNPARNFESTPFINLGEKFAKVSEYMSRFSNIPDVLELDQLTVSGDVYFGSNVVLKGTVIIVAHPGSRIDIPSGSVLENKVITGNLRILDL